MWLLGHEGDKGGIEPRQMMCSVASGGGSNVYSNDGVLMASCISRDELM